MTTLIIGTETTGLLLVAYVRLSDAQPWPKKIAALILDDKLAEIDEGRPWCHRTPHYSGSSLEVTFGTRRPTTV